MRKTPPDSPSALGSGQGAGREQDPNPPLVVLVGPTAVGKTEMAIGLAERMAGEIVSADSRLFYRGMDIGTAKPTLEERQRVPHHLIDVAEADETWSLALFQLAATKSIADIHQRGKLPFLVGGTGQYIQAVTNGWVPPTTNPEPRMRAVLEEWAKEKGNDWLHQRLALIDPQAAGGIDPRNVRRSIRALEVIFSTGRSFSSQRRQVPSPYRLIKVGLIRSRLELYERIDARIEAMFKIGLLEEVHGLLARGRPPSSSTLSTIGYRECVQVLAGHMTIEEAKAQMRRRTRVFVRRQANWFKITDPQIKWFEVGENSLEEIEAYLRDRLSAADMTAPRRSTKRRP